MTIRSAKSRLAGPFFFIGLLLCCAAAAFAQAGRGSINGTISDPNGAAIPGADVALLDSATGTTQHTVSNAAGQYSFIALNPGQFRVTASAAGFGSAAQDRVTVSVDQATDVNISLKVGAATDTVTVTEGVDLVEPSNSTVGQLIGAETIDRVPLLTRNVYDLVQLSAGVTPANGAPNSSSSFAIQNISSGRPGVDVSSYTVNGAIQGSLYYLADGSPLGVSESNPSTIIPALDLPEDAVDEIRVETQNTPASYQSGGAGVISLVSKSGTDKFHGTAFGVFRPDVLAANEYFNKQSELENGDPNTPPSFHRYQEGGSIGGPILHHKLFFFGDYEATQEELFDGSNTYSVPTTAERTGDFSNDDFNIYNPFVPDNPDGTRQQYAGNIITNPNPIALKFLSELPKCNVNPQTCDTDPNGTFNNFFAPGLDPTTAQRFDTRIDWVQSEKQRVFGRFSFARLFTSTFNAFGNDYDINYAQQISNARNFVVGDDLTLSPTTVLQLRYSFTRLFQNQGGDPAQIGTDITQLGFPASLAAQETYKILPFLLFDDAGGGVGGTGDFNTFIYSSENSDASASLTKIVGKHELNFGFEYLKRLYNAGQPGTPSGEYSFDISPTDQTTSSGVGGSDFASALAGVGTSPGTEGNDYGQNFSKDLFAAESSPYYGSFFQDTYRPNNSFTVTAGLRWDIFGGRTERHNRLEYFDPTATNTVNSVAYTGAEVYATSGNRSPFETNLLDFSPRAGISWQPVTHLVVRAGAGIYYGPSAEQPGSAAQASDGYNAYTTWNATNYNNDPNTIAYDCNFNVQLCGSSQGNTVPNVLPGGTATPGGPFTLSNPFPQGVVQQISSPSGLGNNLGTTLNTVQHSQRTLTTYNFNFGLEYELPHQVVLSAAYVGSRGLFLPFVQVDVNQLDLATIASNQGALLSTLVPNQWEGIQPATNSNAGSSTVPLFVSLQQYPQFGNGGYGAGNGVIVHGLPIGDSEYSSLQTKVQKRLTSHVTALASFTWAKLITDDSVPPLSFVGSHAGSPQDFKNLNLEHSVSPQDVKYQFTGQVSYDLPIGKGRALDLHRAGNAFAGGWTTNGILYISDGIPIASPVAGGGGQIYFNQRANLNCDPSKGAPRNATQFFNYNCFSTPSSLFVPGTAPAYLDHLRTEGAQDLDLSVYKHFAFGETKDLRFEVSSYNIANRAQLGYPTTPDIFDTLTPPPTQANPNPQPPAAAGTIGQVTATINTPRQFQFSAKFTF
ncbi:MAG TPA: carboxypeptidase regulatory-like domain-containing protein [Terracidiphilus sp.]|nr:carboxypeptidase regulatory-like domain-containing protein [Terracidiphilus sp.]